MALDGFELCWLSKLFKILKVVLHGNFAVAKIISQDKEVLHIHFPPLTSSNRAVWIPLWPQIKTKNSKWWDGCCVMSNNVCVWECSTGLEENRYKSVDRKSILAVALHLEYRFQWFYSLKVNYLIRLFRGNNQPVKEYWLNMMSASSFWSNLSPSAFLLAMSAH